MSNPNQDKQHAEMLQNGFKTIYTEKNMSYPKEKLKGNLEIFDKLLSDLNIGHKHDENCEWNCHLRKTLISYVLQSQLDLISSIIKDLEDTNPKEYVSTEYKCGYDELKQHIIFFLNDIKNEEYN